ncbi:MAG: hypothetical protein IT374_22955 [Polyangiaceae bacterium]|nr:hypothetical protein [Polyangiaceae bacterium]
MIDAREVTRSPALLARYPYYAAVLARLDVVEDPTVESMGVSLHGRRFYLHVNPEALARRPEFTLGILLHEVHHVVLGHLTDPALAEPAHPDLMELAKEASANEWIVEPLPDPITVRALERWGVRRGQSTRERYLRLVAAREREGDALRAAPRFVDDHRTQARGGARTVPAADPTPALVRDAIAAVGDRREIDGGAPERATLAGRDPGRLLELLEGASRAPAAPLDWRSALAMFVAARRAPEHSWSRPSRRFPSRIGEIPGRAWVSRRNARPRLLISLDTSASLPDTTLAEIARHLREISAHADLVVAEIDVEVARVGPFDGVLRDVAGRGGTDLRPAFEPRFLGPLAVDGVVYFTDGDGPWPEAAPALPVLWVLTPGAEFGCPWGARATLTIG